MADVKSGLNQLFLREEELRQAMELMFFAYRDFTGVADAILEDLGFGRAHHRALYFIGRHPGISVTELLAILRITKQSLSRVLSELVEKGFVSQRSDHKDRRKRLLELTETGRALERGVSERQRARVAEAYRAAGAQAVEGFKKVMLGMMSEQDRQRFRPLAG